MRKLSFLDRLRYAFDNTMSRGAVALIGWLGLASLIMIVAVALFVSLTGIDPENRNFIDLLWSGLMHSIDAGTVAGDAGSWPWLITMLVLTFGGIFVFSTLIGVLTTGINDQLDQLRKGRSFVAEEGHTVILGWSSQIFTVISELAIAKESEARPVIAVLAEHDKIEMEDAIREHAGQGKLRVVCRTGSPIDLADLEIVNPHASRSIIILPPESDDPDASVIKTILAITNNPRRRAEPYHIVAVIRDPKNLDVARMVGGKETRIVIAGDLIARVAAQTCRQSGLSVAYTELLDFGGDEIYFHEEAALVGKTFGESLFAYESSTLIGIATATDEVILKPPMERRIAPGDRMILIAEDDSAIRLGASEGLRLNEAAIQTAAQSDPAPEATLILGWNERALTIIRELDSYVSPGSEITVVAHGLGETSAEDISESLAAGQYRNIRLDFLPGDTNDRALLDSLNIPRFDHVIVLSYEEGLDQQQADARTLITLLHLRDISQKVGKSFSIVSEMLDVRNRQLAEVTQADDFIISDRLISLMLAQISENAGLADVFADLFDPEGAEIYLKPAENLVKPGIEVNFGTVIEAGRRQNAVAIGYRLASQAKAESASYGVQINPPKSAPVTFSPGDKVILIADD